MKPFNYIKNYSIEIITVLIMILSLSFFVGTSKTHINSDGVGYYDYLPSAFINNDLIRFQNPVSSNDGTYDRINTLSQYIPIDDFKVNKYPIGVSILLLPFFLLSYLYYLSDIQIIEGYEVGFQNMVFIGSLFYLFLSLIFLKKTLETYNIKRSIINVVILAAGLSSNVINYINTEATFSHVYSLFAISGFIYFIRRYNNRQDKFSLYATAISLGLIFLLRQINVLIVFSIPFLFDNYENLKNKVINLISSKVELFKAIIIFSSIISLQLITWFLQTGKLYVDTYQNEKFFFLEPEFYNILFSYKKGLFIYTPSAFISFIAIFIFIYKKEYYKSATWILFFLIVTYFLSAWWAWWYSMSYGLRAYIEFLPMFFLLFAIGVNSLNKKAQVVLLTLLILTIPVNHIQARQYKNYILHWENMNKDKYWNVFLSNSNRFIGLNWKRDYNFNDYNLISVKSTKDCVILPDHGELLFSQELTKGNGLLNSKLLKLLIENNFDKKQRAEIDVVIKNKFNNDFVFTARFPFIHLVQTRFGIYQKGYYCLELPNLAPEADYLLEVRILARDSKVEIKKAYLSFRKPINLQ